jgi:hypothetical protein
MFGKVETLILYFVNILKLIEPAKNIVDKKKARPSLFFFYLISYDGSANLIG